jgi:hypothetical protein
MTVGGIVLYAEPRLMDRPRSLAEDDDGNAERISIEEIVCSKDSCVIYSPPECGATALGKRLAYEISRVQDAQVIIRSAASLPNYRAKFLHCPLILKTGFSFLMNLILIEIIGF